MTVCKGAGPTMVSAMVTAKTVIDQSMTLFLRFPTCNTIRKLSLTGQWHFFCNSPLVIRPKNVINRSMTLFESIISKLSLTGQWHFMRVLLKSVIDHWFFLRFPTCNTTQNCHWPVNDTFFCDSPLVIRSKTVIDQSMTLFLRFPTCNTTQNCHWPVNDSFSANPHL